MKKNIYNETKNITQEDIYPYLGDEKYRKLLLRFMATKQSDSDEFIISEAIQIYAQLGEKDYELKLRILELLKDVEF